ncbi:hypothetical protein HYZ99_01355 [Candidatus Peregrinibacteria bacterium]|nr:hypothetical protein [Candidatus Peregrinibacteria bacterium]
MIAPFAFFSYVVPADRLATAFAVRNRVINTFTKIAFPFIAVALFSFVQFVVSASGAGARIVGVRDGASRAFTLVRAACSTVALLSSAFIHRAVAAFFFATAPR